MLLTITCKDPDARDLSWLMHKRPERFQFFNLPYGKAHVFFPEYSDEKTIACLLLEVESAGLNEICKAREGEFQYVNPRQFLSGSLLASAIAKVFASAIKGICEERSELAQKPFNFEIEIANFSCRLKPEYVERLFAPLGYEIKFVPLTNQYAERTMQFGNLRLSAKATLRNILSQLFILLPVFDRQIHFWIGEDQLEKFVRHAKGWLENHPEKRFIINEYFWQAAELKYCVIEQFDALAVVEEPAPYLKALRQIKIAEILAQHNAKSVLDLGCGNGSLLQHLAAQKTFARLCGMDISARNIEDARKRLCAPGRRFCADGDIFVSSLTYRDKRFAGHDALVLSEVIEHFERERMDIVMKNILE